MDEQQLILAIRSQGCSENTKQQAFTVLYQKFQPKVTAYLCHLLHRKPDDTIVTDLVAESFTKAFLKIGSYKEQFPYLCWQKQIALNCLRDYFRKHKREHSTYAEYNEESKSIRNLQDNTSADSGIICKENIRIVKKHISSLPEKHRKVMELRFFRNESYSSIATLLHTNCGTVSSIILRCRAQLKMKLNP